MSFEHSPQSNDFHSLIFLLISQSNLAEISKLLSLKKTFNFFIISDPKGYTVLHHSALVNNYNFLELFLNYMQNSLEYEPSIFHDWINASSLDEGFTALHLSSYKGNTKFSKLLIKNGALLEKRSFQGFSTLHIAAQADQVASIVFLKGLNAELNALDCKGSTPLHWAAYTGCENAIYYLTRWAVEINRKDGDQGYTPLHLATITGNSKIVRRLLIKGADIGIKDNLGKTAAELAKEHNFNNIFKMLENPYKFMECYQITPNVHIKRSQIYFITFWLSFFVLNGFFSLIILAYVKNLIWIWMNISLWTITFIFYLCSWLKHPGFLTKNPDSSLLDLLEAYGLNDICPDCAIIKPKRSKHCDTCKCCVEVFDHHCPWINNCVGVKNRGHFLCFLIFLWIFLAFIIISGGFHINKFEIQWAYWENAFFLSQETAYLIKIVGIVALGLISLIFLFPLTILVYVQITNFLMKKTTAERFGYKAKQTKETQSLEEVQDRYEKHMESAETAPILISSKGLLSKEKKIEGFKGGEYFRNCMAMCFINKKEVFPDKL